MGYCSSCCSPNIVSNKIGVASFHLLTRQAEWLRTAGRPAAAIGTVTVWGLSHVANAFADTYRCADCGHSFS